jgi:uncharacterized protein
MDKRLVGKISGMHIIIDGYNIIRQSDVLRRFDRLNLEAGRNALIHRVALYKKSKQYQVTIVFDGWVSGSVTEERDRQEGIDIVYSRRGEKADEVIKRMASIRRQETVIVTSDREIAGYVQRHRGTAISSQDFELLMDRAITTAVTPNIHFQTDGKDQTNEDAEQRTKKKKGTARRLSRKKKATLVAFSKL